MGSVCYSGMNIIFFSFLPIEKTSFLIDFWEFSTGIKELHV